jgi:hypothetical protein
MKALPIFLAYVAAFAPSASHAVVDMGGAPGISDLYELEFNNGGLFPEDFDATWDHDGDGISTLMEYRCFWSDPFDANDCGPKLQLAPFGGGEWQASWQTRKGLRYQLEFSPDLVTWLPAGSSVVGTGGIVKRGVDPGVDARIFYRLSCPDASVIDGDDDQVSAPEEGIAGTSDNMEMSDPASGVNDIFKAAAIVLAAVAPPPGPQFCTLEPGTAITGLPHTEITEIPPDQAMVKGGYFSAPAITDPENWDRVPAAGGWRPFAGSHLELQKGDGTSQPWYGQWCELDAHWQNADREDHSGPIAHGIRQTIPEVPCGRTLILFFDCCRRYAGADTVKVSANTGFPSTETTLLTHTAPGGWERVMVPLKIVPPASTIRSTPLCLTFDIGDGLDSYGIFVDNIELIAMDIVPGDGMAGTLGDVVPSVLAGSAVRHFVTPAKAAGIAGDFVELQATGLNAVCFGERFAWDGGEAGAAPVKRRVPRAAAGMAEVRIRPLVSATTTAAQMDVWTVWADGQKVAEYPILTEQFIVETGDGTEGDGINLKGGYDFRFTISPAAIITAVERPKLEGGSEFGLHLVDSPGAGTRHVTTGRDLAGGVDRKWDVSRRIRSKILNPALYPKGKLVAVPGILWDAQPKAEDTPATFPSDTVIGNDDPRIVDESNDPYNSCGISRLAHGIGEITSYDSPSFSMRHSIGSDGDTFEVRRHFGEFSRLLIGPKWYRISGFFEWRAHYKLKREGGLWVDDGSANALDNTAF